MAQGCLGIIAAIGLLLLVGFVALVVIVGRSGDDEEQNGAEQTRIESQRPAPEPQPEPQEQAQPAEEQPQPAAEDAGGQADAAVQQEQPQPEPIQPAAVHTVSAGDTLYRLARRYSVDINNLLAFNEDLELDTILNIGREILIPPADWAAGDPLPGADEQDGEQDEAAAAQDAEDAAGSEEDEAFAPYEDESVTQLGEYVFYTTTRDPIDDALTSLISVRHTEASSFEIEPAMLLLGCFEGDFQVVVTGMPFTFLERELDMEYRINQADAVAAKWEIVDDGNLSTAASPPDDRGFAEQLRNAETVVIRGRDNDGDLETFEFAVARLFDTPIQPNLDRCGEY